MLNVFRCLIFRTTFIVSNLASIIGHLTTKHTLSPHRNVPYNISYFMIFHSLCFHFNIFDRTSFNYLQIQNFFKSRLLAEMTPEQHFREGTVNFFRGVALTGARCGRVHLAVILFIVSSVTSYPFKTKAPDYSGKMKI